MRPRDVPVTLLDYIEDWSGNIRLLIAIYKASILAKGVVRTFLQVSYGEIMREFNKMVPMSIGDCRYRVLRDLLSRAGLIKLIPLKRYKYDVQLTEKGVVAA